MVKFLLWFTDVYFLSVYLHDRERERALFSSSMYRAINPIVGNLSSWSHLNLIFLIWLQNNFLSNDDPVPAQLYYPMVWNAVIWQFWAIMTSQVLPYTSWAAVLLKKSSYTYFILIKVVESFWLFFELICRFLWT